MKVTEMGNQTQASAVTWLRYILANNW